MINFILSREAQLHKKKTNWKSRDETSQIVKTSRIELNLSLKNSKTKKKFDDIDNDNDDDHED